MLPVFALANAGIPVELASLSQTFSHPVTLGIILGLVAGKFLGIFLSGWLVVKSGIGRLPPGVSYNH